MVRYLRWIAVGSLLKKIKVFFGKNYRLSMMVKILEKMDKEKKKRIYSAAEDFIKRNTN